MAYMTSTSEPRDDDERVAVREWRQCGGGAEGQGSWDSRAQPRSLMGRQQPDAVLNSRRSTTLSEGASGWGRGAGGRHTDTQSRWTGARVGDTQTNSRTTTTGGEATNRIAPAWPMVSLCRRDAALDSADRARPAAARSVPEHGCQPSPCSSDRLLILRIGPAAAICCCSGLVCLVSSSASSSSATAFTAPLAASGPGSSLLLWLRHGQRATAARLFSAPRASGAQRLPAPTSSSPATTPLTRESLGQDFQRLSLCHSLLLLLLLLLSFPGRRLFLAGPPLSQPFPRQNCLRLLPIILLADP